MVHVYKTHARREIQIHISSNTSKFNIFHEQNVNNILLINIIKLCFNKTIVIIIITQFLLFQVFVFCNIYLKLLLLKNIVFYKTAYNL